MQAQFKIGNLRVQPVSKLLPAMLSAGLGSPLAIQGRLYRGNHMSSRCNPICSLLALAIDFGRLFPVPLQFRLRLRQFLLIFRHPFCPLGLIPINPLSI